jgi:hypothetical protein
MNKSLFGLCLRPGLLFLVLAHASHAATIARAQVAQPELAPPTANPSKPAPTAPPPSVPPHELPVTAVPAPAPAQAEAASVTAPELPPTNTVTEPPSKQGEAAAEHLEAMPAPDSSAAAGPAAKFPPNSIVHVPGHGVTFVDGDGSRYRMRMAIAPMMRFVHESTVSDDSLILTIRRARLSFDTHLPYDLRTRFDLQIKNTGLTFRQIYGAWAPSRSFQLYVGLIKPPGGLEMDNSIFEEPFTDRSVLAGMFTKEYHELGAKAEGWFGRSKWFYGISLTRVAPSIEPISDEPEDKLKVPATAEAEDVLNAPGKWNTAGRIGVAPSKHVETSVSWQLRFRGEYEEPDYGETFAEPYEALLVSQRPYYGVSAHVKGDAAWTRRHFRFMGAVGYRRDGQQLQVDFTTGKQTKLPGHLEIEAAQLTFGYAPFGNYGAARRNAPLLDGWEILTRLEGARIKPVDIDQVLYMGVYAGINWQVHPELRIQLDYAFELFNENAEGGQANAKRHLVNLWAVFRI